MTEEVVVPQEEVKPQEVVVETKPEAVELSEVEQGAFKEGWRPKDQYDGDSAKWIPADEFMRRKPLFEKIDSLKSESFHTRKELQEVKGTLKVLAEHHQKVRETEYARALEELKTQRKLAVEDRDTGAVEAIEEKMDAVKEEKTAFDQQIKQETKANTAPTPEFVDWVKENGWYHTDKEMHDFADGVAASHLQRNPHSAPNEVFEYVNKQTKRAFPEKFTDESSPSPDNGAKRRTPSPVDSGSQTRPSSVKDDYKLSPEEDEVARRFERSGIMTRKEYAAEIRKINKR